MEQSGSWPFLLQDFADPVPGNPICPSLEIICNYCYFIYWCNFYFIVDLLWVPFCRAKLTVQNGIPNRVSAHAAHLLYPSQPPSSAASSRDGSPPTMLTLTRTSLPPSRRRQCETLFPRLKCSNSRHRGRVRGCVVSLVARLQPRFAALLKLYLRFCRTIPFQTTFAARRPPSPPLRRLPAPRRLPRRRREKGAVGRTSIALLLRVLVVMIPMLLQF